MFWGCLALTVAALLIHGIGLLPGLSGRHWLLLAYMGIIGTALPYLLFNAILPTAGVLRAVGYKLLIPVFGILLSFFLLGERPNRQVLIGGAVIIGALFLIQRGRQAL
jgi:drug/metabolite transporter (DMT)-like permease